MVSGTKDAPLKPKFKPDFPRPIEELIFTHSEHME